MKRIKEKTATSRAHKKEDGSDIAAYKRKIGRKKRRDLEKFLIMLLVIIALAAIVVIVFQRRVYHQYTSLSSVKNEDVQSYGYVQMDDCILKYGTNGAFLLDKDQNTVWSQSFEMTNPVADVCENTAVVADKDSTLMYIFTKEKPVGAVETAQPVLKARVARTGVVAAVLQDGEKTWINFYAKDGSLIAENQTRIDSPGYPLDIAVSPDGKLIMVSYLYAENSQTNSYVAYYNFSSAGEGEIDNIVAAYTYEGIVVPQVEYLGDGTSLAFRENGFSVYEGNDAPKETAKVEIKGKIISTFYNEKYAGMVFKSDDKDKKYTMQVYDLNGKMKFEKNFNLEYTDIQISNNMIIMNNDTQACMVNLNGREKFNGSFDEGTVKNIFRIASNRYILVSDKGVHTIKLK